MKAPPMSLVLEHIYGVQTADRRHTVMFLHSYSHVDQSRQEATKQQAISISEALGLGGAASAKLDMILPQVLGEEYADLL